MTDEITYDDPVFVEFDLCLTQETGAVTRAERTAFGVIARSPTPRRRYQAAESPGCGIHGTHLPHAPVR